MGAFAADVIKLLQTASVQNGMRYHLIAAVSLTIALAGCSDSEQSKIKSPKTAEAETHAPVEVAPQLQKPIVIIDPALSDPGVAVSDIARGYKQFRRMTPERGVPVSLELSGLCRGVMEFDVKAAQKTLGVHAHSAISIYMSPPAATAFEQHKNTYPPGSIIIKEKAFGTYQKYSSSLETVHPKDGVGGMIKRAPGYDGDHGDWEYFYFEDPTKIETGKISSCVTCHAGAAETDHVFGSWGAWVLKH